MRYEILKTLKTLEPLTEGKIDPVAQMCMDIENDSNPKTSSVYCGLGCGIKITKKNIDEIWEKLDA